MNDLKLLAEQYEYMQDIQILENISSEDDSISQKIKALLPSLKQAKESGNMIEYKDIANQITDLLADYFKQEAEDAVKEFEGSGIKTTRGNYARYGSFLSQFQGMYRVGIVKALRRAGAGRGLDDALRVF
jgi:hypothetical protein